MVETSPRARSFWGWGWADRFWDRAARKTFSEQLASVAGFGGTSLEDPAELGSIALAPPAIEAPPELSVTSDREARIRHTYGRGYRDLVRGFSGDFRSAPDLVGQPKDEQEIEAILAWADRSQVFVVPFGGGTSVVQGVEVDRRTHDRPVLSLDLRGLDQVLEIDPVSLAARVQAGVFGPALEARLKTHDLTLRHFPQSFEFSTLGGWIATRAGGHFATHRTRIDDFVESVRMITPRGIFENRRLPASGAGPAPERFVLGSEGALGVITEAWVRVLRVPKLKSRASLRFSSFHEGAEAARAIVQSGLCPANLRLLDPLEARLNVVTQDDVAVLLLGFESADATQEEPLARAIALAADLGGKLERPPQHLTERGPARADADRWKEAFFSGPYLQNVLVSIGVIGDTFETACLWSRFEELDRSVRATMKEVLARVAGGGSLSARLTHVYPDGVAPYYTFLCPARRGAELEQWAEIKAAAAGAILRAGGTITHHHAVGRLHRPWYETERSEVFAKMFAAAKAAVDPQGIMNPGVLL